MRAPSGSPGGRASGASCALHGVRNLLYALLFAALGFAEPGGALALAFLGLLVAELVITLWDFVEEDRSRLLPASERVTHTLARAQLRRDPRSARAAAAGLVGRPTALTGAWHGPWSWLCAFGAVGDSRCSGCATSPRRGAWRACSAADPARLARGVVAHRRVLVTGGTGFIGGRLVAALAAAGHRGHRADPRPRPGPRSAGAGPDRHLARPDPLRRADRRRSSTSPASRSRTGPGPPRRRRGSSNRAAPSPLRSAG